MNRHWIAASVCAACLAAMGAAAAQTSPGTAAGPVAQHSPGNIDYISGGAGEEERTAMAARQAEFPLKMVFSAAGGEYLVADAFSVRTAQGEILTVRDAGPLLMIKLPAGQYSFEATWHGKTERRAVTVGSAAQTVNWRFPG